MVDSPDDVERKLSALDEPSKKKLTTSISDREARWKLTYGVVYAYLAVLLGSALYLIARSLWCGGDVFASLLEIIKTGFLPIVTLVIGYRFGSSSEKKPE